jgi:hypothetical protein
MSIIIEKVKTLLQKRDFHPINAPDNDELLILTGLTGYSGGQFNVQYIGKDASKDNDAILLVTTQFPIKIPSNKTEKVMSFLNRMNNDAWFSWFTIDNGQIISQSGVRSKSNDSMNDDIIDPFLFSALGRLDTMQPFIMDLIYSEKTVDDILKEMKAKIN